MGRYDLRPLRVYQTATRIVQTHKGSAPPPWYDVVGAIPPSQPLVRPILKTYPIHFSKKGRRKPSKLFKPQKIVYFEDVLREEFYRDHPWELARPKVVLEDDGRDAARWDWSKIEQPGKKLDGESVVQRQMWLMENQGVSRAAAYDQARREFYEHRHLEDVERRVAREEALSTGAYFGKSAVEVGMELEDKQWEAWKVWAQKQITAMKQAQGAVLTSIDNDDAAIDPKDEEVLHSLDEVGKSVPNNEKGQRAEGGAPLHP